MMTSESKSQSMRVAQIHEVGGLATLLDVACSLEF